MTLNKKTLFLGIIIGVTGNLLYRLSKKPKKEFVLINKYKSNSYCNTNNYSSKTTFNKDNILSSFNELKKQRNLIEEKLNKLKNE